MFNKTKVNFWLDLIIFSVFVFTAATGLLLWLVIPGGQGSGQFITFLGLTRRTWLTWHSWLGLGILIGVGFHLWLHWTWLTCVAGRFFKKLAGPARLNFSLDSLLFGVFFLISLSGLINWLVLPGGGHRGGRNLGLETSLLGLARHDWSDLHRWAGLAMMVILVVHLAWHWDWLTCMVRRYLQPAICRSPECGETD